MQFSLDGKGQWPDNVFIERPWRGVKNEKYLPACLRDRNAVANKAGRSTYPVRSLRKKVGKIEGDEIMTEDQFSVKASRLKRVAQELVVAPALSLSMLIGGPSGVSIPANAQSTSQTASVPPQEFSASDPYPNFTGTGRNGLFAWAPGGEGVPQLVSLRGGSAMYPGFVKQGGGEATSYLAFRSAGPKENIIYAYDGTTLTQVESTPRSIIRPRALRNPHLVGWNSSNETQVASSNPGNPSPNEGLRGVLSPSIAAAGRPAVAAADGSIPGALSSGKSGRC